ncbi:MAG: lysophospholipid acyltransferase family protein [Eubacteriales bacterium]
MCAKPDNNTSPSKEPSATCKKPKRPRNQGRLYTFLHFLLALPFRLVFCVKRRGLEHVPREGGYLLCANHIAMADVIVIAASLPRQVHFLAKSELFRVPLVAPLITALGAVSLDRSGRDVDAIKKSVQTVQAGKLLAMFPQGTRRPEQNPADTPLRGGAGMITCRAQSPVLPVCLKIKRQKYALFRRVEVIFGAPIPYEAFAFERGSSAEYMTATKQIFAAICALGGYTPTPSEPPATP